MLAAYLAATILGGTLLTASLVTGHHGASHELEHQHGSEQGGVLAAFVLSLRFWTYLLAFGGASGFLLHKVAHLGEPLALALSLLVGAASGIGAQIAIHKLTQDGQAGVVSPRELVYRLGTLLLPASPGVPSRVRLTINNQTVDLTAVTEDVSIAAREEVLVLEIKDGVALVTRNNPKQENP
jgi:hypothetical protein